jgi:maleate isomerase
MTENVEAAAQLLADARVDLIAFHCTAASTLEPGLIEEIKKSIEDKTGISATTTGHAATAALHALKVQRIAFVCPNRLETHQREIQFFRSHDFEVVADRCMGIVEAEKFPAIEPDAFADLVLGLDADRAEAVFIGCTAVRSAEAIEDLEKKLGRPVLTSNQAMVWHALRTSGIADQVTGFGRLLSSH